MTARRPYVKIPFPLLRRARFSYTLWAGQIAYTQKGTAHYGNRNERFTSRGRR